MSVLVPPCHKSLDHCNAGKLAWHADTSLLAPTAPHMRGQQCRTAAGRPCGMGPEAPTGARMPPQPDLQRCRASACCPTDSKPKHAACQETAASSRRPARSSSRTSILSLSPTSRSSDSKHTRANKLARLRRLAECRRARQDSSPAALLARWRRPSAGWVMQVPIVHAPLPATSRSWGVPPRHRRSRARARVQPAAERGTCPKNPCLCLFLTLIWLQLCPSPLGTGAWQPAVPPPPGCWRQPSCWRRCRALPQQRRCQASRATRLAYHAQAPPAG